MRKVRDMRRKKNLLILQKKIYWKKLEHENNKPNDLKYLLQKNYFKTYFVIKLNVDLTFELCGNDLIYFRKVVKIIQKVTTSPPLIDQASIFSSLNRAICQTNPNNISIVALMTAMGEHCSTLNDLVTKH
jgi:hypothetical protein